jgi:hypothetical protein
VKKVTGTGKARYSSLRGPLLRTSRVVPRNISVPEWAGIFYLDAWIIVIICLKDLIKRMNDTIDEDREE